MDIVPVVMVLLYFWYVRVHVTHDNQEYLAKIFLFFSGRQNGFICYLNII
jgi:hypothetical protein